LAEAPAIGAFALRRIPARHRERTVRILGEIDAVLGGFVRGQLTVAAAVGTLTTIALAILHVPYALLIGLWAGLADVVPYVGPFAGGVPAAIVAGTTRGWGSLLGLGIAFFVINQIEGHLLAPRIVSRTVRISPLGVIFSLWIGAQLFGFVGLIVAVPLAGLARLALVSVFPQRETMHEQPG
jgi:predicted PurR-regulated permease PerM